ncbi:hypothetical protein K438DRAFT_865096 [Mycena galopus ATCC 62051]|nr:hypothetical protein K438DRAFT_865096 [Mycena galopus ATCC 62051]
MRLADVSQWNGLSDQSCWPTVFLAHSLKSKEKLGVHKALEFLGDVFYHEEDEQTAFTLYTIALEGFTYMDVHQSRAECMLRLGDIAKRRGDLVTAISHWETAKPLFERSSQSKHAENVDERLAEVGEDRLARYRAKFNLLAELQPPSGIGEEVHNDLRNTKEQHGILNL